MPILNLKRQTNTDRDKHIGAAYPARCKPTKNGELGSNLGALTNHALIRVKPIF